MISEKDLEQLKNLGITQERFEWQLGIFREGMQYLELQRPATIRDGIITAASDEANRLMNIYDTSEASKVKFVPASGAASRMFKDLYAYIDKNPVEDIPSDNIIREFITHIRSFAFFSDLEECANKHGTTIDDLIIGKNYVNILRLLLDKEGLDYGSLPKGLIKFHRYLKGSRTAFEEHMAEGAIYARNVSNLVQLHFTVSPEHTESFRNLLHQVQPVFEKKFGITCQVSFSVQDPSTDTVAADSDNNPFRNADGSMVFRPGGHGALLKNLCIPDSDIIFIKNIDNVIPEHRISTTAKYKKILAGKLLEVRSKVFDILREMDVKIPDAKRLQEIQKFIEITLNYKFSKVSFTGNTSETTALFRQILNRPLRVCGVVKNTGEPGGGPYWAKNTRGDISLQIVESSQVNMNDSKQAGIFTGATHFNPVDIVCTTKNYKGEKYNLQDFVDPTACFISYKSKDGKPLKALELPGLWNGSMSDWTTIFMEVPIGTFNPVKTVNDLLRNEHQ